MTVTNPLLDAALEYAGLGWQVFPLQGKQPATIHSFKDAATDLDQVRAWWQRWPDANVGIAVPVGNVVVDIDPRDGGDQSLAELERSYGQLPATLTTITGSGGWHRWFKTRTDGLLQSDLGKGLQTRVGGKGYVVAPPSIHPETGQPYAWVEPFAAVAWLPSWICSRLLPPRLDFAGRPSFTVISGQGGDFLDWAYRRIANAPMGSGHHTLLRTARLAGGYIAAGLVSESEARRTLLDAVGSWANPYANAERTIADGLEHGRHEPVQAS